MDGEEDQRDQHEERLREVFQSFDGSGAGSLSPEELTDLCHALQLADQALHTLLHTLFNTQDQLNTRVEFEQFKDALILVLSSNEETLAKENPPRPVSPEVQPRFVKGTKRYGRRSTPEFTHSISNLAHTPSVEREEDAETRTSDGTLPVKRERWNADVSSPEEYEAEGQLHLWNPDEPGTPRGSMAPFSDLEERLYSACQQLSLPLHGTATIQQLRTLCQHLGLEVGEDAFQSADEKNVSVQEFVSYIQTNSKPPTPSASTPYRQLKRHHSTQPFDEMGRRISSVVSSTIGLRLFSELDDGTGHTAVELLLDAWLEDGVDNSSEILQALDFSLEGKVNLGELTAALENELMVTKNSIHQAALASFKAEIRYLLERVDLELREKEKLQSDLEKAEKLKSQLASEVDERHSAIERINDLNLQRLEQEHKDRVVALRAELSKEVELVQQQANQQREELEQEVSKIREDETFLREHLTLTIKENGRMEAELLDSTKRLMEAEAQLNKLQKNLDNVLREKFGDLDLSNAEFYQQEERFRQLQNSYEEQCRELQDRIDELQAQLEEFRALNRAPQPSLMPSLSDELDSKSPGMESDQGLGSEEGQPFNMSLEAEMMLEQLKEQHIRELEDMRVQLDSTVNKCEHRLEEQKTSLEEEKSLLSLQHQQEVKAMREEVNEALARARDLQEQLEQERRSMEAQQSVELAELHAVYQKQVGSLSQELQDARIHALKLEEQLRVLEERERGAEESRARDKEELSRAHAEELSRMELHYKETLKTSLQNQKEESERTLSEELEKERQHLEEVHEEVLRVRLKEVQQRAEQERIELERRLREEWEWDKQQLEESSRKTLQEELENLQKEQEESSKRLREMWEKEHILLQEQHHTELQKCLQQERERLQAQEEDKERRRMEEWERDRVQLHEQHEELLQARLEEQRAQLQAQGEEQEKRWQKVLEEQQGQMEEAHREAMQELSVKHSEQREILSCMLEKLRTEISKERAKHSQSKVAALTQHHAADHVQWGAEQQRILLQEALQLEKETLVTELTLKRLKHSHTVDMDALMKSNLQLQSELENIVSSARIKETEFSRELSELRDRLQENLRDKDTLLVQTENKAAKIELLLRQAMNDLARERAKFQNCLFELERQHALSFVEKQQQERRDLVTEQKELRGKIEEMEHHLQEAVEDFHNERLELQGTVAELEEKLKNSVSIAVKQEEQRVALLAERDKLALKVHQIESCDGEAIRCQTMSSQIVQDRSLSDLPIEFVIESQDPSADNFIVNDICNNVMAEQSKVFCVLGENSPMAQHEELEKQLSLQEEGTRDIENPEPLNAQTLKIISGEILTFPGGNNRDGPEKAEDDRFTDAVTSGTGELDEPYSYESLCVDIAERPESITKDSASFPFDNLAVTSTEKITECGTDYEFLDSSVGTRSSTEETKSLVGGELCEHSAEASTKVVAFGIISIVTEDMVRPKGADCEIADIDPVNNTQHDESTQNIELNSGTFSKDTVEMADEEVPRWSSDEFNPVGVLVKNGTNCISTEIVQHDSNRARQFKDANIITNTTDPNLLVVKSAQADVSYHEEPMHGLEMQEKIEADTTTIVKTDDSSTNSPQDQVLALECGPMQKKENEETAHGADLCAIEILELQAIAVQFKYQSSLLELLQEQYRSTVKQNLSLKEQLVDLHHRNDKLELLLDLNRGKFLTSQKVLEESHDLRMDLIVMAGHAKELELKVLKLAELQLHYEKCVCENVQLSEQKMKLERRVQHLESEMHIVQEFQEQQSSLLKQILSMHKENARRRTAVHDLEHQDKVLLMLQEEAESISIDSSDDSFQDLSFQLGMKIATVWELEDCCLEFANQNPCLQSAGINLQEKCLRINKKIQEHSDADFWYLCRSEAGRLAEENILLRQNISELREEDLKERQQELLLKVEHFRKEKNAAQKMADGLKRQISELRRRGKKLEEENNALSQQNAKHALSVDTLQHTLEEVILHHGNGSSNERSETGAASVSRTEKLEEEKKLLRAELNRCVEKMAQLRSAETQLAQLLHERQMADKHNQALRTQMIKAQERVQALDFTLQGLTQQNARLKSDLRITQQERDTLKQEVISLHKQLQNANEKCRLVEMSGVPVSSHQGKRVWAELSGLMEAELSLLREENQRLQREISDARLELSSAREKARQLEALVLSVKQQKQQNQASLAKTAEQERSALKREIEALQTQLHNKLCDSTEEQRENENLHEENERLRNRQTILEAQLMEAQLIAMLPPSPLRLSAERRGQCHGDEMNPDINKEQEVALLKMEERMKEVELTLRNVKLLLQEKVSQLKEQLNKNSKADVLIKDLYVENSQLLKALEVSEQRQKVAEKKNYLLEEKISSLNKIVRELSPSPLMPVPYHMTRS
ncbi:hypothetical protein PGIGA_G00186490 [Pangasianodon gigas]|uniref:Uncharacterized protein n=1 Tax=Pangasianodon gigas TaxID=30993 RepID=A0ACC5WBC9_PANGG|nr:hypothetical protein [Pangasianodon gigas]